MSCETFITKCLFDWIRVFGTICILNQQTTFSLQVRMTAEYWMMNVVCVRALVSVCECVRMCARARVYACVHCNHTISRITLQHMCAPK